MEGRFLSRSHLYLFVPMAGEGAVSAPAPVCCVHCCHQHCHTFTSWGEEWWNMYIQYDTGASRYYIISSFLLLLVVMFTSVLVLLTYKFEVNIWNAEWRIFLLSNTYVYCECRQAGTGHLGKQCRYTDSAHMQWCHTATGAGPSVRVSPIMSHSSPFLHLLSLSPSPASSHLSIHRLFQFYLNIWIRRY